MCIELGVSLGFERWVTPFINSTFVAIIVGSCVLKNNLHAWMDVWNGSTITFKRMRLLTSLNKKIILLWYFPIIGFFLCQRSAALYDVVSWYHFPFDLLFSKSFNCHILLWIVNSRWISLQCFSFSKLSILTYFSNTDTSCNDWCWN